MGNAQDKKREDLREQLWPESESSIWKGPKEKGYWCAPRVLPLLLHLTADKRIVGRQNCSSVYTELLSRDFGQGIVEIRDEDENAYCAGYTGPRAKRTWQERMRLLKEAGFIKIVPKGNRSNGYVLLVHFSRFVTELRKQGKIGDDWWHLFEEQLRNIGAEVLTDPLAARELRLINGGAGEANSLQGVLENERKVGKGTRKKA